MWNKIVRYILGNRVGLLIGIGLLTVFMAFMAMRVQMTYTMPQVLPDSNQTMIDYKKFLEQYGADGNVMFAGVCDERLYELNNFKAWDVLAYRVKEVEGVTMTLSFCNAFQLVKEDTKNKFVLKDVFMRKPIDQTELDSLINVLNTLPFYDGFLYNSETGATLMMIFFDKEKINTSARDKIVKDLEHLFADFSQKTGIETNVSGLPYVRTITSLKLKRELVLFSFLAVLIAAIILMLFFRSFRAMVGPIMIVVITVIWTLGLMALLGYEITVLASMLPPLLIIIGIENSIFLTNKYHYEYRKHGNKVLALSRAIRRIGRANFTVNLTTAIGFTAFVITPNKMLIQFGITATLAIMLSYVLILILLPIFFSYTAPPNTRQTVHLDSKWMNTILAGIEWLILKKRAWVFAIAGILFVVSVIGVTQLRTSGRIVDDIPKRDKLYQDLLFFEDHFDGIVPLEITIDTKRPHGVLRMPFLSKLSDFQDELMLFPEFAKPLSIIEVLKYGKQAYYNGNPMFYDMPNSNEMAFIMGYLPDIGASNDNPIANQIMKIFVDSTLQKTRISVQMKNLTTPQIDTLKEDLQMIVDDMFEKDRYDVNITGSSVVFLEGTTFLINNLLQSLALALVLIVAIMAILFSSVRMIILATLPNLLPLIITAAIMGFFNIPLKMSTILVFSIALGISVDNTIHFLSRYRLELRINNGKVKPSVIYALGESGFSMFYSSTILFLGFLIFAFSSFGGTQSVGVLVSLTLLVALLANLLLLPSLILVFGKPVKRPKKTNE
ncbi:MAG: MMPL family transporter [Bacteroidales bacterium]|jgi:predicted RND superfamily exporter protein|nr:MMPL family transporter [Bacteroidales bacterium]